MKNKIWMKFFIACCGAIFLTGCSKDEDSKTLAELIPMPAEPSGENLQPEIIKSPPKYTYPFSTKRDPFSPLIGKIAGGGSAGGDLSKGQLGNLELKGILKDNKGKIAVIETTDREPFLIKSGRVYDRKNRIVSGVSGIIKQTSVVLISRTGTVVELKLRNDDGNAGLVVKPQ